MEKQPVPNSLRMFVGVDHRPNSAWLGTASGATFDVLGQEGAERTISVTILAQGAAVHEHRKGLTLELAGPDDRSSGSLQVELFRRSNSDEAGVVRGFTRHFSFGQYEAVLRKGDTVLDRFAFSIRADTTRE
jgi:hypothetical protein